MLLGELCNGWISVPAEYGELEIVQVECDSRETTAGSLFIAVPGETTDGLLYAAEAVRRGAAAVIAPQGAAGEADLGVPILGWRMYATSWGK